MHICKPPQFFFIFSWVEFFFLIFARRPTFVTIWKKKSVEQFSPVPYLATFINCMIWILYGLPIIKPNNILVLTINGAGVLIEIVYISLFLFYSAGKSRRKIILILIGEIIFIAAVALIVLTVAHTTQKRTLMVGIICIVFNVGMYAAPLSIMKMVITTNSVEYMPFTISLASFLNGASWVCYAIFEFDLFIVVPNGLGTLFSLAQLILYAAYYKSTKRIFIERKARELQGIDLDEITVNCGSTRVHDIREAR
uniref:Bidirectional sugar transporter SWEET n=1 Tax=Kalanchoe fedtschenkoi TaxID=63787 RepID=A0A7N0UJ36_KALFE